MNSSSLSSKPLSFPDGTPKGPGAIPALTGWPPLRKNPGAICYEDDFFLILNKPAGMLVHPTAREDGSTLWNYVRRYYDSQGLSLGIHPVSRLDRFTSGLVIFAKYASLQAALSHQSLLKEYLAVTVGAPPARHGILEDPIARKEGSIIEREVRPDGKPCRTEYEVLERHGDLSLVQCRLYTGRTHQVRVHFAHAGFPLWQDHLYGAPGEQARHGLHAWRVGFRHPRTGRWLEITTALPEDLREALREGKAR